FPGDALVLLTLATPWTMTMMQPRDCSNCGKPAESPFIIARFGVSAKSERVFCRDCLDQLRKLEEAAKDLEEEIRSGSICYLCYEELNPPGGTTISLGGLVRRLCPSCKDGFERCVKRGDNEAHFALQRVAIGLVERTEE